ncbi:hypothetical protein HPB51_007784 [Rhipicephalus microplus]|uniref:Uncharacterized protein n=1 Tax=Rhipicephalus microplus TaxID=6941 RepID=A0A9J6F053_RHIMP|nr:hypothetical protein HPB51_007784 [Rhipicephalus microplus]
MHDLNSCAQGNKPGPSRYVPLHLCKDRSVFPGPPQGNAQDYGQKSFPEPQRGEDWGARDGFRGDRADFLNFGGRNKRNDGPVRNNAFASCQSGGSNGRSPDEMTREAPLESSRDGDGWGPDDRGENWDCRNGGQRSLDTDEDWTRPLPRDERIERELLSHGHTGINFEKYEDIPVEVTGDDAPKHINSFDDCSLTRRLTGSVYANRFERQAVAIMSSPSLTAAGRVFAFAKLFPVSDDINSSRHKDKSPEIG